MYPRNQHYNTYQNLISYIQDFNKNNKIEFNIDTIRIEFQKQHKLTDLKDFGKWHKLNKKCENIKNKLNKRLDEDEVTSVYQLENYNIYYYNSNKDKTYRKAVMVIFGLKQYHKKPLSQQLVEKIVNMLTYKNSKNENNIDVCFDMGIKPKIENLKEHFYIKRYIEPDTKKPTDTYYINNNGVSMIDKICIYNKALKNDLKETLYRIEATISIPNIKVLALPLHDFKNIIDIARGQDEIIIKDE